MSVIQAAIVAVNAAHVKKAEEEEQSKKALQKKQAKKND